MSDVQQARRGTETAGPSLRVSDLYEGVDEAPRLPAQEVRAERRTRRPLELHLELEAAPEIQPEEEDQMEKMAQAQIEGMAENLGVMPDLETGSAPTTLRERPESLEQPPADVARRETEFLRAGSGFGVSTRETPSRRRQLNWR